MKPKANKYRITNLDILKMVKRANRETVSFPKGTITNDKRKHADKYKCRLKKDEE